MAEINMRQIEVFLMAAKYQNLSRAASELYISQPSLSKHIAKMEKEIGASLFQRTNRGVVLTKEGEELYARLDFVYHRFRVNVEEICAYNTRRDTLRIGSLNRQIPYDVASEQTQAYCLQHPEQSLYLERFDARSLRDKLLSEELDLIVTLDSELLPREEFQAMPLCDYPLFFIVSPQWGSGGLQALTGQTLLIESPTQRRWSEAVCREYRIVPGDVRFVSSYALLATRIGRGEGFSIDSKMFDTPASPMKLTYLPVKWALSGTVVMAWRRHHVPEHVTRFVEFLRPGTTENEERIV